MSGSIPTASQSYLDIVNTCDNFRFANCSETLLTWCLTPESAAPAIGLLRPEIVAQLQDENQKGKHVWEFITREDGRRAVSFASWITTSAQRTRVMKEMLERWRDEGLWPNNIGPKKWRAEMYPVYRNPFGAHDAPTEDVEVAHAIEEPNVDSHATNYAFMMERSACSLFCVVTYGVHMTMYEDFVDGAGSRSARLWVPTRSKTKQTWPGYLDNSVAGGIPCGMKAFESLVKESMEEASIEEEIVRKHARAAGGVSYFSRTDAGWLHPEVQYIYDLRIPPGADPAPFQPKPLDGEVESFELLPLSKIIPLMRMGRFKRNCAFVIVDFMIRHGFLTAEEEPHFLEIVTRLHGSFEYEKW